MKPMFARRTLASIAAAAATSAMLVLSAGAVEPVNIRIAADNSGPPHPAGIAMEFFADRVKEAIPGSEVRTFFAGSLYRIPEAVVAMTDGDLEMTWGQYGKSIPIEPLSALVVGPQLLTTPGAIVRMDETEAFALLQDRFRQAHNVELFGSGNQSLFIGVGATQRIAWPDDFADLKIRTPDPLTGAAIEAWGGSSTTMSFGDVPPALQTGVIDGLVTSLNGFNATRDQAPFFTVAGMNGIMGDFYWIGASGQWWDGLDNEQRDILSGIILDEMLPLQRQLNWCNDQRIVSEYSTEDPAQPGIYVMSTEQRDAMAEQLGSARDNWVRENTDEGSHGLIEAFVSEARALSAENPMGSSALEATDCASLASYFEQYGG